MMRAAGDGAARLAAARADRRALARRAADPARRSRSPNLTLTRAAGRCWSAAARAGAAARSAWTTGPGKSCNRGSICALELPVGPLFCIITGPTRGRRWSTAAARAQLRRTAAAAGVRRRFAPHQLRHAHAVEMAHEGVPLIVIQRQLGHSNLGITSIYLQGIDNAEIIDTVHARRAPMIRVALAPTLSLFFFFLIDCCFSSKALLRRVRRNPVGAVGGDRVLMGIVRASSRPPPALAMCSRRSP